MEITKTYPVSIDRLFEAIVTSLKEDYRQNTGEEPAEVDLVAGLTYQKRFGEKHQHSVQVTLLELTSPSLYSVRFSSNRGKETMTYQLTPIDEGHTGIQYSYGVEAADFFTKANYFLMEKLMAKSLERQTEAQLDALVRYATQEAG
ncbi:DUF3284 domain-containing protein [Streptococcus suis]|uniref:DUF3284 domain-containing protein n=1 Tax=Streptococcus suis TaxID=1307 RepID=UPI000CF4C1BB|nr:DUF3284 domain-containing protein [Streptococcus suis]NQP65296.1 DUF3284 domain-containing protein [Streptococcus suis]